jgi:hypothetical protein
MGCVNSVFLRTSSRPDPQEPTTTTTARRSAAEAYSTDIPPPGTTPQTKGPEPLRKDTWRRWVSTLSWATTLSKRDTVNTFLEGEDRARRDESPEASISDTVRADEGGEEFDAGEPDELDELDEPDDLETIVRGCRHVQLRFKGNNIVAVQPISEAYQIDGFHSRTSFIDEQSARYCSLPGIYTHFLQSVRSNILDFSTAQGRP